MRFKAHAVLSSLGVAALVLSTAPVASATESNDASATEYACWGSMEGDSLCATSQEELDQLLLDERGLVIVDSVAEAAEFDARAEKASTSRGDNSVVTPQAVVAGVTLYDGGSFSGTYLTLTFNKYSGVNCGGSAISLLAYNRGPLLKWDNAVSSYEVKAPGCITAVYRDGNYQGDYHRTSISANSIQLGSLNNQISSVRTY